MSSRRRDHRGRWPTWAGELRAWAAELRAWAATGAHLSGRVMLRGVARRLPPGLADKLRRPAHPSRVRDRVLHPVRQVVRRGGCWFGEHGWEPELLPWWRYACRHTSKIVELGTNVGPFCCAGRDRRTSGGVRGRRAAPLFRPGLPGQPRPQRHRLRCGASGCRVAMLPVAATADPSQPATKLVIPWEQLATPTQGRWLVDVLSSRTAPCVSARRSTAGS
jgi:hypothetical protein